MPQSDASKDLPLTWTKHLAVGGPGTARGNDAHDLGPVERRAIKRRAEQAAEHAVRSVLPGIAGAVVVLALALAALHPSGCPDASPAALLLGSSAAAFSVWQLPRRLAQTRTFAPAVWAANLAGLWLMLSPGLVCAELRPIAAGLALVAAMACAPGLSPHRKAGIGMVLAPLVAACWVLDGNWNWLLLGCVGTVGAAIASLEGHRRWQTTVRALLESLDSKKQVERERNDAWRKDHEKSRFLAIASHDLRQPVHALALFAATLQRRLSQTVDEPLARNLARAVDGLERSFTALLDISKLDAGALEPRIETFALRDMFRRLHMQYAGQAEIAGLGLRFSTGGKSVTSDPQLLERMVGNLIHNAIKYTTHGGIVVVARTAHDGLNLEVWDTGAGIAAQDLPRIFDEFFQVGRPERDRSHGLGMGLAIVKRLAALLGHRLEVASSPGRGTRFRIGIPQGSLPGIQEDMAPADTQPMPMADSRLVLVVDDEEAIREGLRLLLQEWGYSVMTASDADQAEQVATALEGRLDLILSDLHLGEGPDGVDTIAAVRRICGRDVPALLITGDAVPQHLSHARESDVAVLIKPVHGRLLLDAMRNALH